MLRVQDRRSSPSPKTSGRAQGRASTTHGVRAWSPTGCWSVREPNSSSRHVAGSRIQSAGQSGSGTAGSANRWSRRLRTRTTLRAQVCQERPFPLASRSGWNCSRTASAQADSARGIHLSAWFPVVPASGSLRSDGETERSMSSGNRSITRNTFDSEVPPLKTRRSLNSERKSTPSSQQNQKSFVQDDGRQASRGGRLFEVEPAFLARKLEERESHVRAAARSRKMGCIHVGARRRSSRSFRRSAVGSVRFRWARRSGVTCSWPSSRNA